MLLEADRGAQLQPVRLRLRGLRRGDGRRRHRRGRAPSWSPAGCSPRSAAAFPHSRWRSPPTAPRSIVACGSARFTLLPCLWRTTRPCRPCRRPTGTVRSDVFASAVAQVAVAAGRDDTLPCSPACASRSRATPSPWPPPTATGSRSASSSGSRRTPTSSAVALVPAKTLADTAKSLTGGAEVIHRAVRPRRRRRGHDRLRGRRPPHHHPAAGRRVPQVPVAASRRSPQLASPRSRPPPFVEAVKRVALVAERNTPVRLSLRAGRAGAGGRHRRRGTGCGGARRHAGGRRHQIAFNPTFLLDGLGAIDSDVARLQFTTSTKPAILTGKPADDGDRRGLPLPDHAGAAVQLTDPRRPRRTPTHLATSKGRRAWNSA